MSFLRVSWNTRRLAAMFPGVAIQACLLVSSPFRVYAKLKPKNWKPQTTNVDQPFAVNVMLNLFDNDKRDAKAQSPDL